MCHAVTCKACGGITWKGCGLHVDQVLRDVPESERCPGHPEAVKQSRSGLWRLFSRG